MTISTGNLPPAPVREPIVLEGGGASMNWRNWFTSIYNKVGGVGSADFVPVISADSVAGTPSYATQIGRFTTLGTIRMVEFELVLNGWSGSPSGNVILSGFPTKFLLGNSSGTINLYSKVTLNSGHSQLGILGVQGQDYAYFYSSGSGSGVSAAKIPVTNVATTARIVGNIVYSA